MYHWCTKDSSSTPENIICRWTPTSSIHPTFIKSIPMGACPKRQTAARYENPSHASRLTHHSWDETWLGTRYPCPKGLQEERQHPLAGTGPQCLSFTTTSYTATMHIRHSSHPTQSPTLHVVTSRCHSQSDTQDSLLDPKPCHTYFLPSSFWFDTTYWTNLCRMKLISRTNL